MPDLRERLYATWIARLGRSRVAEIANAGTTLAEKAEAIVSSSRPAALDALLVDGFFHHFHQSVYVRTLARGAASLRDVDRRQTGNGVRVRLEDAGSLLLMVSQDIEFLPSDGTPFTEKIDFPVLIRGGGGTLVIQVITMQSDVETWSQIVDVPVRRILTPISSDKIHDQVLEFLNGTLGVRFGGYIDYSARAIEFIQEFSVDTFSGRYEVGAAGVNESQTVGATDGRRPKDAQRLDLGLQRSRARPWELRSSNHFRSSSSSTAGPAAARRRAKRAPRGSGTVST